MDIDSAMEKIGDFGPAQIKIVILANLAHVISGFHAMVFSFIAIDPGWFCAGKEVQSGLEACAMLESGKCTPEYHTKNFTSIVSEWDLICTEESLPNLSQSAFFVGSLMGAFIWGRVTDRIGRRKAFFISAGCVFATGIGYSLAFSYYIFVIFRILSAISTAGFIMASFVLSVEIVGVSARRISGLLGSALFGLAYSVVAVLAYFIRSWRALSIVLSVIGLGIFAVIRMIPESPRWLLVNGYSAEARVVLESIAKDNGTVLPQEELKKPDTSSSESLGMAALLKGKVTRQRTVILFIVWFTECIAYYALAMRSGDLAANRYTSFALSGFIEIPALYLAYKLLDRLGRRWTHGGFLLSSGVACLMWSMLYWTGRESLGPPIALFGKFSLSGAFGVAYLYTTELFPTQVRNLALGVASIGARLGGILSPILIMTAKINNGVPMLLLGCLAFFTGLLSFSLPETLNQPLPNTLRELESPPPPSTLNQ